MTKNPKLTVSAIITFVLALWETIQPLAETVFGIGTKGLVIASFIVTVLSFVYNYFSPEKSLFSVLKDSIGGGGIKNPNPKG